jgi:hypothetical protein
MSTMNNDQHLLNFCFPPALPLHKALKFWGRLFNRSVSVPKTCISLFGSTDFLGNLASKGQKKSSIASSALSIFNPQGVSAGNERWVEASASGSHGSNHHMTVGFPLTAECIAANQCIHFPRLEICFLFEDLSDDLGVADVKVTTDIM